MISSLIIILFIVFLINQTAQVIELSKNVSEDFSKFVLFFLIIIYSLLIIIPIYLFISLPSSLKIPESINSPEYQKYIQQLRKRLKKNKYIKEKNISVDSEEDLKNALNYLNEIADQEIKKNAIGVFTVTALSQSGRLDGLIVLTLLTKMIYKIALIYNQRPNISDLIQLYANVFMTTFLAYTIEEINIEEQLDPIIDNLTEISAIGVMKSVPFSGLVGKMLLDGAINAYLTLRVGIITKNYCSSLVKPERKTLRRSASIQAAKMTVVLVKEIGMDITKKIARKMKDKLSQAGETFIEKAKGIFGSFKNLFGI